MNKRSFLKLSGAITGLLIVGLIIFFQSPSPKNEIEEDMLLRPRPDVLAWIDRHYGNDHRMKTALIRWAEVYQRILSHPDDPRDTSNKMDVATGCEPSSLTNGSEEIEGMELGEAIRVRTFNSRSRARKFIKFNAWTSGKVFRLHIVNSWEAECEKPFWP